MYRHRSRPHRVVGQSGRSFARHALDDSGEPPANLASRGGELIVVDDREHPLRVDRGDARPTVLLVDDYVARQEHAKLGFGFERSVRQRRVARPEDQVGLALYAELLLERGLHVDLAQDPDTSRASSARARVTVSVNGRSVVAVSV